MTRSSGFEVESVVGKLSMREQRVAMLMFLISRIKSLTLTIYVDETMFLRGTEEKEIIDTVTEEQKVHRLS